MAFLFLPYSTYSQSKSKLNRIYRKADRLYSFTEYNKALPLYLTLLEKKPDDVIFNFRVGLCYLFSNVESQKSIRYLETARKNIKTHNDSIAEIYYYSGYAYHLFNRFEEAIPEFKTAISLIDKNDSLDTHFIDEEIEQCNYGKTLMQNQTDDRIFFLGQNINSIYPDYSPVITPDQSMLIFTSKRKGSTGNKITPEGDFYEDIFVAKNNSDEWTVCSKLDSCFVKPNFWASLFSPAKSIGNAINTNEHDASISLSPDGKKLFIYRFNAVWESEFNNGIWNKPTKLNNYINGKRSHEPSVSLTIDGNTLYFVSERDGGFGGKDIYKSVKQADGTWGPAENLGPTINTEEDEEAPYIDPEDQTLYFSSLGHLSIGGFDVFKTKFENNEWKTPENLGYPINSGADDIFYIFNDKQNKGYISSVRKDGLGNFDIFAVRKVKPVNVILFATYGKNLKPLDLKGAIVSVSGNDTMPVFLNKSNTLVYAKAGTFKLTTPEYNTNKLNTFEFKTPESFGDYPFYQEINYDEVKNYMGQLIGYKTTLTNSFFDIGKDLKRVAKKDSIINKELEYSSYAKTLIPDYINLQVFSQINYIDTSSFAIIAAEKAELLAKKAAETLKAAELEKMKTQKAYELAEAKAISARARAKAKGTDAAEKAALDAETVAIAAKEKALKAAEFAVTAKLNEQESIKNAIAAKELAAISTTVANTISSSDSITASSTTSIVPNSITDTSSTISAPVFKTVLFAFAKSKLTPESKNELDKIVSYLNSNEQISMEIIGHTDSEGSKSFNLQLSKDRAKTVKKYLVSKGINHRRLKTFGFGESQPVAPNKNTDHSDNPEGRKQNRRIEFKVLKSK